MLMKELRVEILLVEDNRDDAELTQLALQEFFGEGTFKVLRNGATALDFIFCQGEYSGRNINEQPKLILLDIKLPKIDGIKVLQRLKAEPSTRSIPVVMLSSSRQENDIRTCMELGANSYIVKPFSLSEFEATVRQIGTYWMRFHIGGVTVV